MDEFSIVHLGFVSGIGCCIFAILFYVYIEVYYRLTGQYLSISDSWHVNAIPLVALFACLGSLTVTLGSVFYYLVFTF